jgi:hypothetical protein
MMPNVERSYRITLGRWLRLYIVAFGVLWIGLLVQVMLAGNIGSWFVPVILGLLGALWFTRFFGLAVDVGPEGVVVRNLFRTMRLPWQRIDGFRVQRGLGFGSPLGRTVCLLLDGGDALTIDATMRSWAFTGGHRQVQEMVVRLQASLDEAHRQRADGTA